MFILRYRYELNLSFYVTDEDDSHQNHNGNSQVKLKQLQTLQFKRRLGHGEDNLCPESFNFMFEESVAESYFVLR